jgi:hypothetical protein
LLPTIGGLFPGILRDVAGLTRLTLQHAAVVGGPQALTGVWACVFEERGGGRRGLRCSMLVGRAVGGGCEGVRGGRLSRIVAGRPGSDC